MAWDADSNRVSFTSSTGGSYAFVYDITAGIPAVIKEIGPGYPKTYVREPDGSLVAMFVSSYPYYYHFDVLGSTRMLTDETGHITDTYTYDAWGNASHTSGTTEQPYQYVGQLGYYTHYQDANLPLLQLGVRFYDPQIGRFTQKDPVGDGWCSYECVTGMPSRMVDPSGRKGKLPSALLGGPIATCVWIAFKEGEYYNEHRHILKFNDNDKWVHCFVVCKATRCVLRNPFAACLGTLWGDMNHPPWDDWEDYTDHAKYNHAGMRIGMGFGPCESECWDFWKKDHDRSGNR